MYTEEAVSGEQKKRPDYRRTALDVLDHLAEVSDALRAAHAALGPISPEEGQTSTYMRGLLTALKATLDGVGDNINAMIELKDREIQRDG